MVVAYVGADLDYRVPDTGDTLGVVDTDQGGRVEHMGSRDWVLVENEEGSCSCLHHLCRHYPKPPFYLLLRLLFLV